jgi:hypothetical protein
MRETLWLKGKILIFAEKRKFYEKKFHEFPHFWHQEKSVVFDSFYLTISLFLLLDLTDRMRFSFPPY